MKARFAATLFVLLSFGLCILMMPARCSVDNPESRQAVEFAWDRTPTKTRLFNIPVVFPRWNLTQADRDNILRVVDTYASSMCVYYPWCKDNFDFSAYTVIIHDNLGGFLAGVPSNPIWARGWQVGRFCVVAWDFERGPEEEPIGVSDQNILPALPHEWFHAIFTERYGCGDAGHFYYFPRLEVLKAMALSQAMSPKIELSPELVESVKNYKYVPWVFNVPE